MMKTLLLFLGCCLSVVSLSAQSPTDPDPVKVHLARQFLLSKSGELGLTAEDIGQLKLSSQTYSKQSGVTHLHFIQALDGIEIYNAMLSVHLKKDNSVLTYVSRAIPGAGAKVTKNKVVGVKAADAIGHAARQLGYTTQNKLKKISSKNGKSLGENAFEDPSLSTEPIVVKLMYLAMPDGKLRLVWDLNLAEPKGKDWWSVRIDATNGDLLSKTNWIKTCSFGAADPGCKHESHRHLRPMPAAPAAAPAAAAMGSMYNVYALPVESPNYGGRSIVSDPFDVSASPYGWHDTNGADGAEYTITRGNNVYAQYDDDGDNGTLGFAPDGGASLVFDFPLDLTQAPATNISATITNLFYANNYLHDFTHRYGFNESNGNFQQNNYGNGGSGGDYVIADAQDASDTNNARFGTPVDGTSGRMSMYLWDYTNPLRSGDIDNLVIGHEFGHGVSTRLTGGPANSDCLDNDEQMGEGWSDWLGLMITMQPGDQGTDARGVGTYVRGQAPDGGGIRPTRYSTDMSINTATYDDIKTAAIPHGVGYVWAGMIWDLTWALIDEHGQSSGFDKAMNIIIEGMKLQPCSPGFVDGRDAILAADESLYGGENYCLIWRVFARRGLGVSASQGSSASRSDGVEAYDTPESDYGLSIVSIATCYPSAAAAEAAAISATSVTGEPLGEVTFTASTSGTCNAVVTVTATDECGNVRTANFNTRVDNTNPTFSVCPPNVTVNVDADCEITLADYRDAASAGDNCGTPALAQAPAPGTVISGAGVTQVTLTATDACGNTGTCQFNVTRNDVTPPVITCPANQTIALDENCQYALEDLRGLATITDNCGIASTAQSPAIGTPYYGVGNSSVTLTTTDLSGNTASCSFTVFREDQTPPVFDPLPSNLELECNAATNAAAIAAWLADFGGVDATDNCSEILTWAHDYDPQPSVACAAGETVVTFSVTDEYNNTSTATASLIIIDSTPPVITFPALSKTAFCNSTAQNELDLFLRNNGNARATDVCSGQAVAWTNNYYENLSNGCGNTGTISVTFTATDICGNKAYTTASFTINDVAAPVLTIPANVTVACGASTLPANTGQATATDVCSGPPSQSGQIWINEFHYAQSGADNNEFVEVAGAAGTSLNGTTIYLYRSTDGKFYYTRPLSGVIPDMGNGKGVLSFNFPGNTIRDGIDAIALMHGATLMDFVSYGGAFRATNGSAFGVTSVNIGVTESDAGPNNVSLQRIGAGRLANTFTWSGPALSSPGAWNAGQTILPVGPSSPAPVVSYTDTYSNPNPCGRTISRKWKATDDCGLVSTQLIQLIKVNIGSLLVDDSEGDSPAEETAEDIRQSAEDLSGFVLLQNVPNPWGEATLIQVQSPVDVAAELRIYSLDGRVVYRESSDLQKGLNQWQLTANQLPASGFYYYEVVTAGWKAGKKMLLRQ